MPGPKQHGALIPGYKLSFREISLFDNNAVKNIDCPLALIAFRSDGSYSQPMQGSFKCAPKL